MHRPHRVLHRSFTLSSNKLPTVRINVGTRTDYQPNVRDHDSECRFITKIPLAVGVELSYRRRDDEKLVADVTHRVKTPTYAEQSLYVHYNWRCEALTSFIIQFIDFYSSNEIAKLFFPWRWCWNNAWLRRSFEIDSAEESLYLE